MHLEESVRIIMADGTSKAVCDIEPDTDFLLDPHSLQPKKIPAPVVADGPVFRVYQTNGIDYTVGHKQNIQVIIVAPNSVTRKGKKPCNITILGEIHEKGDQLLLTPEEFIALPRTVKEKKIRGTRVVPQYTQEPENPVDYHGLGAKFALDHIKTRSVLKAPKESRLDYLGGILESIGVTSDTDATSCYVKKVHPTVLDEIKGVSKTLGFRVTTTANRVRITGNGVPGCREYNNKKSTMHSKLVIETVGNAVCYEFPGVQGCFLEDYTVLG